MAEPSAGERELAARFELAAADVAAARVALNAIAALAWPVPERRSFLARLAKAAHADVGVVLAGKALAIAPLAGFERLEPVIGLAKKRVVGLVKALAAVDVAALVPEAKRVAELEQEVARLRAMLAGGAGPVTKPNLPVPVPAPGIMRLEDVASSIAEQVASVDGFLAVQARGLRLAGVTLDLRAASAKLDEDVALDLDAPGGGSRVGLAFMAGGATPAGNAASVAVPDVRGYTAALARRKLVAAGFAMSSASRIDARGVVEQQVPGAGAQVAHGSTVRLLFA
jgi:hypothetical protein